MKWQYSGVGDKLCAFRIKTVFRQRKIVYANLRVSVFKRFSTNPFQSCNSNASGEYRFEEFIKPSGTSILSMKKLNAKTTSGRNGQKYILVYKKTHP